MGLGVPSSPVGSISTPITTCAVVASIALVAALPPAIASADDDPVPTPVPTPVSSPAVEDGLQHNVTYRARVDGIARGALISYRISDAQVNSADPTMLPGRTFETTGVLSDADEAGMRISIQWPYSANLVCEILVDDQIIAAASQFIGPRLTPAADDPDYGALNCGAPLTNAIGAPAGATTGGVEPPLPGTAVDPTDPGLNPPAPVN